MLGFRCLHPHVQVNSKSEMAGWQAASLRVRVHVNSETFRKEGNAPLLEGAGARERPWWRV